MLHRQLGLPQDRPLLRTAMAITFAPKEPTKRGPGTTMYSVYCVLERIRDTHIKSGLTSSVGKQYAVSGSYDYYHYMQDNVNDNGWGCAYRSMQTICSWFKIQNYTTKPVPSIREIQKILVEIGDKPKEFYGSSQWIGAIEISMCLNELYDVRVKRYITTYYFIKATGVRQLL